MAQKEKETKVIKNNIISGLPFLRELMTSSGSEMGVMENEVVEVGDTFRIT